MSAKNKNVKTREFLAKPSKADKVHTINFVEDGMTALGWSWYRGETLTVEEGTDAWDRTLFENDEGETVSWLTLDEDEQVDRWGLRFFREGKWKGKGYDLSDPALTDEQKAILQAAQEEAEGKKAPARRKVPAAKRAPARPPKASVVSADS